MVTNRNGARRGWLNTMPEMMPECQDCVYLVFDVVSLGFDIDLGIFGRYSTKSFFSL